MRLAVLSAGAAQGVVSALAQETGFEVTGSFGAVGSMNEKLLAGEPADLVILTSAQIAELAASDHVLRDSCAELGRVRTGIAVRAGDPLPDLSSAAALRAALAAADGIYLPDPQKATAGIHFAKVLDALGIRAEVASRLRSHPKGAIAMRELARAPEARPIGCTQITEINDTPGVTLAGPLPKEFELATTYSAAVSARTAQPEAARRFVALLTGESSRARRLKAGFEF